MDAPTCSIANADDIRETAIAVFQALSLLADSTGAANCNDRDFGTSRWQFSINTTRNCCGAGGRSWPIASFRGSAANGRFGGKAATERPLCIALDRSWGGEPLQARSTSRLIPRVAGI